MTKELVGDEFPFANSLNHLTAQLRGYWQADPGIFYVPEPTLDDLPEVQLDPESEARLAYLKELPQPEWIKNRPTSGETDDLPLLEIMTPREVYLRYMMHHKDEAPEDVPLMVEFNRRLLAFLEGLGWEEASAIDPSMIY